MPRKRPPRSTGGRSQQVAGPPRLRSAADQQLFNAAESVLGPDVLLVLMHGTAVAHRLIESRPELSWNVFTFEHFLLSSLVNSLSETDDQKIAEAQVELFCAPDLPDQQFDTILLPTDARGSSELTRDLVQSAVLRLKENGRLIVTTNNGRDRWLHEHLKTLSSRVTVHRDAKGAAYVVRRATPPKKLKNFECEFAFRDNERLVKCYSRPGVFSHRRVDSGARALIASLQLAEEDPKFAIEKARIIDMGCGCGAVATATALRYPDCTMLGIDGHARAIQSTERTASLNSADNVEVLLTADGNIPRPGSWDLFLCNPPYYSDYRISELFLQTAAEVLRPNGRLHLVTKLTEWHSNRAIEIFANGTVHRFGGYDVIVARA